MQDMLKGWHENEWLFYFCLQYGHMLMWLRGKGDISQHRFHSWESSYFSQNRLENAEKLLKQYFWTLPLFSWNVKMNSTAGSCFSSDSSRFHNLTKCCSTHFPDLKSMQHLKKERHYKVLHSQWKTHHYSYFRQI